MDISGYMQKFFNNLNLTDTFHLKDGCGDPFVGLVIPVFQHSNFFNIKRN